MARCCSSAAAAIWCETPDSSSVWFAIRPMAAIAVEISGANLAHFGLNLRSGLGCLFGKFSYFAGHNAEAFAMDAGASCFNIGVESQDAGLRGDGCNELRDLGYAAAGVLQAEDRVFALALAVRDFSAASATATAFLAISRDAGLNFMRGRGHHLQIAVQMFDVCPLRFLGFAEGVEGLLGTDSPITTAPIYSWRSLSIASTWRSSLTGPTAMVILCGSLCLPLGCVPPRMASTFSGPLWKMWIDFPTIWSTGTGRYC